ncbi:hypothetical protein F4811DRAFT_522241 [Daldinia bambusicola]|nr:hypothetical protein F4811DRAFT_522241 [Daldinia bambusicola]
MWCFGALVVSACPGGSALGGGVPRRARGFLAVSARPVEGHCFTLHTSPPSPRHPGFNVTGAGEISPDGEPPRPVGRF